MTTNVIFIVSLQTREDIVAATNGEYLIVSKKTEEVLLNKVCLYSQLTARLHIRLIHSIVLPKNRLSSRPPVATCEPFVRSQNGVVSYVSSPLLHWDSQDHCSTLTSAAQEHQFVYQLHFAAYKGHHRRTWKADGDEQLQT